jgi:hypothetical protein
MSKETCSAAGSFRKSFQALLSKFTLRDRIWWRALDKRMVSAYQVQASRSTAMRRP